jgi:hypothetical protein
MTTKAVPKTNGTSPPDYNPTSPFSAAGERVTSRLAAWATSMEEMADGIADAARDATDRVRAAVERARDAVRTLKLAAEASREVMAELQAEAAAQMEDLERLAAGDDNQAEVLLGVPAAGEFVADSEEEFRRAFGIDPEFHAVDETALDSLTDAEQAVMNAYIEASVAGAAQDTEAGAADVPAPAESEGGASPAEGDAPKRRAARKRKAPESI